MDPSPKALDRTRSGTNDIFIEAG